MSCIQLVLNYTLIFTTKVTNINHSILNLQLISLLTHLKKAIFDDLWRERERERERKTLSCFFDTFHLDLSSKQINRIQRKLILLLWEVFSIKQIYLILVRSSRRVTFRLFYTLNFTLSHPSYLC